jgi:RNA polymerase sigma-70 factor (ECF subfamily)
MLSFIVVSGDVAPAPAPLIEEMLRQAHAAWPELVVPDAEFIAYVAARLPEDVPLHTLCTSDLYLALACANGDARAVAAFERHCIDAIDGTLTRLSADGEVIGEVKQRLRCTLLVGDGKPPAITTFSGRGNLRAWVRVIAVREALALMRAPRKGTSLEDALLEERVLPDDDPELTFLKGTYREAFKSAFAAALGQLGDRDRTLLKQQLLDGLSIDELGALYRVHRATAARWLEQARQHLIEDTLARMRKQLHVQPEELDSILRLIRSQLDMSLNGLQRHNPQL